MGNKIQAKWTASGEQSPFEAILPLTKWEEPDLYGAAFAEQPQNVAEKSGKKSLFAMNNIQRNFGGIIRSKERVTQGLRALFA